jgi:hypothetical protein
MHDVNISTATRLDDVVEVLYLTVHYIPLHPCWDDQVATRTPLIRMPR